MFFTAMPCILFSHRNQYFKISSLLTYRINLLKNNTVLWNSEEAAQLGLDTRHMGPSSEPRIDELLLENLPFFTFMQKSWGTSVDFHSYHILCTNTKFSKLHTWRIAETVSLMIFTLVIERSFTNVVVYSNQDVDWNGWFSFRFQHTRGV